MLLNIFRSATFWFSRPVEKSHLYSNICPILMGNKKYWKHAIYQDKLSSFFLMINRKLAPFTLKWPHHDQLRHTPHHLIMSLSVSFSCPVERRVGLGTSHKLYTISDSHLLCVCLCALASVLSAKSATSAAPLSCITCALCPVSFSLFHHVASLKRKIFYAFVCSTWSRV